jgi:hypothetical protein
LHRSHVPSLEVEPSHLSQLHGHVLLLQYITRSGCALSEMAKL